MTVRPPRGRSEPLKAPRPAALRPGARPLGHARRTKPVRRASRRLTQTRAAALLALLGSAGAIYGLTASDAFGAARVRVEGATWTPESAVVEALDLPRDANLVTLRTDALEAGVARLPAVRSAIVEVALPDTLAVRVTEREPILRWRVGERDFLVDAEGVLLGAVDERTTETAATLPVVSDERVASRSFAVGRRLDAVDLDASTRLGSLVPDDVGSGADRLRIIVNDDVGYALRPVGGEGDWVAIFGFYTPTLRTTELIPGQVRLLRSFLIGREPTVARIVLADDRSGTFVPKPTPTPSATPAP